MLEKHLRAYTKKNTTDYFIHKDLKGFLTRELDFYIKNEVFHLDDLGTEHEVGVEQYVSRVRVMKSICLKVIDFLAQIEDFQKMLFEKKKFVVRTDYCMTLDNVPEELYGQILGNEAQLEEWRALYGIGEEKQQSITSFGSEGIDEEYLKEHPYLVLDTKFFDQKFKDRLLGSFEGLDEATGGLMVNSENWQALNLMQEKYHEKVKCIYIDPPFNTGEDEFIYKDSYQHSSWLSMMENSITKSLSLCKQECPTFLQIDDNELRNVYCLLNHTFTQDNYIATFIWEKRTTRENRRVFSFNHDFILCFAINKSTFEEIRNPLPLTEEVLDRYSNPDNDSRGKWQSVSLNAQAGHATPDQFYTTVTPSGRELDPPPGRCWSVTRLRLEELIEDNRIWFGTDGNNVPRLKKFLSESNEGLTPHTLWKAGEVGTTDSARKYLIHISNKFSVFETPKPLELLSRILSISTNKDTSDITLDYFAGSGSTGHAILDLNKKDDGNRKYILVEMGNYFDTVLKPRIQKVMYSNNWKDSKPQSNDGFSHIFKYQTLEQYEDTLNNIEFTESGTVQRTLADMDGYFLRYML
ncbi:MAG: site-specific DNA-methyltransferase, partial [ANME-2 cluster archaeon]|nr:site-specific DNA-methyltransferase [ANME-2 cluster archaeon]